MMASQKSPWWFALLLIIVAVPALLLCSVASKALAADSWMSQDVSGWLFPAYVIISSFSAWFCYPDRRALAWILFALIVLTDLGLLCIVSS